TVDTSDFVYWIAVTDGCLEEMLHEHVRADDKCKECGKIWPCNMRKRAIEALDMVKSTRFMDSRPRYENLSGDENIASTAAHGVAQGILDDHRQGGSDTCTVSWCASDWPCELYERALIVKQRSGSRTD